MSNLLKRGSTISKSERVIDYNDLIQAKLKSLMGSSKVATDGFVEGLNTDVVEQITSDTENEQIDLEEANAQAESIIADAQAQAESIIADADEQAKVLADIAQQKGYKEGNNKAMAELDEKMNQLELEYNEKKEQLQEEYEQLRQQLEPELVDTLTDVFSKVTKTVAEDNQEIILHLINGVMRNADTSRDFVIKVSPDDYKFLANNQGKIYCAMSREIQLDIIEDVTMKRNECIIETDTGVFNCSLDIELENLIKDLKLLSCI